MSSSIIAELKGLDILAGEVERRLTLMIIRDHDQVPLHIRVIAGILGDVLSSLRIQLAQLPDENLSESQTSGETEDGA